MGSGTITLNSFEPDKINFTDNTLTYKSQGVFDSMRDNYSEIDFHQIGTMTTWGYLKSKESKWVIIEAKYAKIDTRYNDLGREPYSVTISSLPLIQLFKINPYPLFGAQGIYEALHKAVATHYDNALQKVKILQPLKDQSDFEWRLAR